MLNLEKDSWIFTFGHGQQYAGKCVRVYADSYGDARAKMVEKYGTHWAFQYSNDEWEEIKNDPKRYWDMEEEFEVIV